MKGLLGPELAYVDILNQGTQEHMDDEANSVSDFHPIRPSSSGNCTRELAYSLAEYTGLRKYQKNAESPESHRLLNLGGYIERHLISMFERFASVFKIRYKQQTVEFYRLEAKDNPELSHLVEGSLDLVMWSKKYRGVLDVKSKKDRFSAAYASNWDETTDKLKTMKTVQTISDQAFWVEDLPAFLKELRDPFFEANFSQLNGYACTKFLRDRGVDHGAIIQYCKNDSRIREIRFKPSEELFLKVKQKFQTAIDAVAAGNPEQAPQDHILGSLKCAWCRYSKECWGTADSRKAFYSTLPKKQWPTDLARLPSGQALEAEFARFENAQAQEKEAEAAEQEILKDLVARKVTKIRMENGHVYEVKMLKDGPKLRRSKA
jgi:hypothetical protein